MAATSKQELIATTEKEFGKLSKLIASVDPAQALLKDVDDTSIKDVVAHRAHWIGLFLGWYKDGLAGEKVDFPAPGYKWNQLKQYNAALRARQVGVGWEDAQTLLADGHRDLTSFIEGSSESDLYGGPMKGSNNDWTPGRWAEAAGSSHYRSASKYIRSRVKLLTKGTLPGRSEEK
ncbi:MAG: ClbS/DfsB family four-helix bundle protein [Filomicrobium sp.]